MGRIPRGICQSFKFEEVETGNCPNLIVIQGLGSVESLEQLKMQECPKIESLDDLSDLKRLESLFIRGSDELQAVKGLDELEALGYLEFFCLQVIEKFP
ncbi:hypothetical protein NL676_008448 [Syzygium grande]|nr:hypothetical protein NL676_008448 [Syzygium grande]